MLPHTDNSSLQALRLRAEERAQSLAAQPQGDGMDLSPDALRTLVHDLRVHQIELEMQNDELRQTQLELDASRARYFDLYDMAPVGYCTVSEQGLILEANFTAATLLDLVRSDLVNKPVSRFIVQSAQDVYYRCRKALFETDSPQDCELQMRRFDGTPCWVHLKITAAQDLQGVRVQRMVLNDIDKRKRLDEALLIKSQELEAARAVAEKASLAKSDFLSNMSHELRSPLNAILGFAQLMEMGPTEPTSAQKSSIDQILRAGWYLLDLIAEILDLTSIESGQLKLNLEPVSLSDVLQACRNHVAPEADKHAVRMHFAPVDEALLVRADRIRLRQVMLHLLSNAIKYNHAGGALEVTCKQQGGQPPRMRVCVNDTGEGLSADKIAHLFQPFNRLGRETSAEEGTGVGLALSKRLVELMGGTIGAQSTAGVGSMFWIELEQSESPDAKFP